MGKSYHAPGKGTGLSMQLIMCKMREALESSRKIRRITWLLVENTLLCAVDPEDQRTWALFNVPEEPRKWDKYASDIANGVRSPGYSEFEIFHAGYDRDAKHYAPYDPESCAKMLSTYLTPEARTDLFCDLMEAKTNDAVLRDHFPKLDQKLNGLLKKDPRSVTLHRDGMTEKVCTINEAQFYLNIVRFGLTRYNLEDVFKDDQTTTTDAEWEYTKKKDAALLKEFNKIHHTRSGDPPLPEDTLRKIGFTESFLDLLWLDDLHPDEDESLDELD